MKEVKKLPVEWFVEIGIELRQPEHLPTPYHIGWAGSIHFDRYIGAPGNGGGAPALFAGQASADLHAGEQAASATFWLPSGGRST
jgi:hypothetical protein